MQVRLEGQCGHWFSRDCFHQPCQLVRRLSSTGKYLIQNPAGYVRLATPQELEVVSPSSARVKESV